MRVSGEAFDFLFAALDKKGGRPYDTVLHVEKETGKGEDGKVSTAKTILVTTDGRRMHIVEDAGTDFVNTRSGDFNMTKVGKEYLLEKTDSVFPDWRKVAERDDLVKEGKVSLLRKTSRVTELVIAAWVLAEAKVNADYLKPLTKFDSWDLKGKDKNEPVVFKHTLSARMNFTAMIMPYADVDY